MRTKISAMGLLVLSLLTLETAAIAQASPASEQGANQSVGQDTADPARGTERQKRESGNRGYVVGKGGVARAVPPKGKGDSEKAVPANTQAPIGVNEPGVNRAREPQ